MIGELPEELLPSPSQVRCTLALDIFLQLKLIVQTSGLSSIDEAKFAQQVLEARDQSLIKLLEEIVPQAEMDRAWSDGGLDIENLSDRLPFVYAMWALESAPAVDAAAAAVEEALAVRRDNQSSR